MAWYFRLPCRGRLEDCRDLLLYLVKMGSGLSYLTEILHQGMLVGTSMVCIGQAARPKWIHLELTLVNEDWTGDRPPMFVLDEESK